MDFLSAWRNKRLLVTGGTGFIGQPLLKYALECGLQVHNISLNSPVPDGVVNHVVSLGDREQVFDLLEQIRPEGIIHLAASGVVNNTSSFSEMLQNNVAGTENLLAAADAAGCMPAVVLAGSGFEYASQNRPVNESDEVAPFSFYGISKAASAMCAGLYRDKLPITILRLFNVYGPGETEPRLVPYIVACSHKGEQVSLTPGEQMRDFMYVSDVAETFLRAMASPHTKGDLRILNAGSGQAVSLRDFVSTLAAVLAEKGLQPRIEFGARPYREGEPMCYVADTRLLEKTLQWMPATTIRAGLERTVESML